MRFRHCQRNWSGPSQTKSPNYLLPSHVHKLPEPFLHHRNNWCGNASVQNKYYIFHFPAAYMRLSPRCSPNTLLWLLSPYTLPEAPKVPVHYWKLLSTLPRSDLRSVLQHIWSRPQYCNLILQSSLLELLLHWGLHEPLKPAPACIGKAVSHCQPCPFCWHKP